MGEGRPAPLRLRQPGRAGQKQEEGVLLLFIFYQFRLKRYLFFWSANLKIPNKCSTNRGGPLYFCEFLTLLPSHFA